MFSYLLKMTLVIELQKF